MQGCNDGALLRMPWEQGEALQRGARGRREGAIPNQNPCSPRYALGELSRQLCLLGGEGVSGGRGRIPEPARACTLPSILTLRSNGPFPINTVELSWAGNSLGDTRGCVGNSDGGSSWDSLCPFTPEALQGHPGATPEVSDGTDTSLPFKSKKSKTKQAWNSNRYLPTCAHAHGSIIHNSRSSPHIHQRMNVSAQ